MILSQYINTAGKAVKNHFIVRNKNDKIGNYVLFQSYDTIVAVYLIDYSKLIVNSHKYSNTTSKHKNDFIKYMNYKDILKLTEIEFQNYIKNWIE